MNQTRPCLSFYKRIIQKIWVDTNLVLKILKNSSFIDLFWLQLIELVALDFHEIVSTVLIATFQKVYP